MTAAALVYRVETATECRQFQTQEAARAWQRTQPAGSSMTAELVPVDGDTASYQVCNTCAVAIVNDDYSAFDQHQDPDADYARIAAFVETAGYLIPAGQVNKAGYWECEACSQVCIGQAHVLETLA